MLFFTNHQHRSVRKTLEARLETVKVKKDVAKAKIATTQSNGTLSVLFEHRELQP